MATGVAEWLFDSSGLTPHGFCLLWNPGLIWTYALSDIGVGLAYFSIPLTLAVVVRRRLDLVFRPVFWLFATFILLCGLTHWLDVITLWIPVYGLHGVIKAMTAIVSLATAVMLWRLLPEILALPSPAQMQAANQALRESEAQLHQAQKMEAVGQLTGGLAHDLNNMFQAIGGGLTLMERALARGRTAEVEQRYLAPTREALESAARLTHRLLAFSRRQVLQPSTIEPASLIRGMEELFRRTLGPAIRLESRPREGTWFAFSDESQLESALLNLVINARDAMPDGGVLTIRTADMTLTSVELSDQPEAIRPGEYVEITVTDTGTGMPPDVAARAFEPFFTTKPSGQGTGLGLSQLHGFIRQSGGFVRLDSRVGRGTAVHLYLPRHHPAAVEADTTNVAAWSGALAEKVPEMVDATVLVVEDEDTIRSQITETLRGMGCQVWEAENGPGGLAIVLSRDRPIDMLITDVGLPGLNGRQLADAARERRPGLRVLLITGYAGTALDDPLEGEGIAILRKPFSIEDLSARVRAMLGQRVTPR